MPPHNQSIQWFFPEYRYQKKNPDWFWAVGIIAVAIAMVSVLYNNALFAVFTLLGAFTLMMYAAKQPRIISFSVDSRRILINDEEHLFRSLKSFWIHMYDSGDVLIIESAKMLTPYLRIPIAHDVRTEQIRSLFLENLPEKEHHESLSEAIMESLGL
ncbi:MAG: hypothetical protein HZC03_00525 [Candidatus Lloydbacteria bacterium]|nr:hypothetical protein [Candidatus Lloydbacteria bacterium]